MSEFFSVAGELVQSGRPFVVVTVVDTIGSVPQDQGARMIVADGERVHGTVGGGKLEARALKEAISMLAQEAPPKQFYTWSLEKDIGMTCGGSVRLYFELNSLSAWHIVIFGAGHCATALVRLLLELDCRMTIIDTRANWLEELPRTPRVKTLLVPQYDCDEALAQIDSESFVCLMTQGHSTDSPILMKVMNKFPGTLPYLGVIGSKAKAVRLREDLTAAGIDKALHDKFFCPIGLSFGTNKPGEIAVSIAAQLLSERDKQ